MESYSELTRRALDAYAKKMWLRQDGSQKAMRAFEKKVEADPLLRARLLEVEFGGEFLTPSVPCWQIQQWVDTLINHASVNELYFHLQRGCCNDECFADEDDDDDDDEDDDEAFGYDEVEAWWQCRTERGNGVIRHYGGDGDFRGSSVWVGNGRWEHYDPNGAPVACSIWTPESGWSHQHYT